jgi:glutathione S-transferase
VFRPSALTDDPAAEDGIKAKGKANVLTGFKVIEEKLAALGGPKFALGDSLTGVDAYLVTFILWAKRFALDLSPFPNYQKLFESISESQAFKAMSAKQG